MSPKEAETRPWSQLCVDTVGPYRVRRKGKPDLVFQAVTFINPATGWFKIKNVKLRKPMKYRTQQNQIWLARYPWPESITYDGGPEFQKEFGDLLRNEYPSIKRKPYSKKKSPIQCHNRKITWYDR